MNLVKEQSELQSKADKLREIVSYFQDYYQLKARLYAPPPHGT